MGNSAAGGGGWGSINMHYATKSGLKRKNRKRREDIIYNLSSHFFNVDIDSRVSWLMVRVFITAKKKQPIFGSEFSAKAGVASMASTLAFNENWI